ncbi:MAG: tetratricopeptide repeat protein [Cytophagales bacterium]|jgi:outer membrane protein assembly factor BamD (BamD/ComL family)|nr:tetratricopeptide repeat protein [Cytophagales bacterium]MCA6386352.1 tetratricopeptide repeat protein [Cytophagales bacterium]MCA6390477.1 tetratricopeptide repeat protein [Cytophagales bacterium]MCA6395055.1 tetratricopeptide repeat protein [Cytophagales bacterium]MCA6397965.1 tetratricopeptide repeat protein [Cytophagales bacterium]
MGNYKYKKLKKFIFNTILALLCAQLAIAQETQEIQIANEYLLRGEKNKALAAFQQLSKNPQNASSIHTSYFNLMIELGNFKQAEDYIEKLIRREDRLNYRLDLGILYLRSGDVTKADKYLKALIKTNADDAYKAKTISDYLASRNLVDYSIFSLQQSRVAANNQHIFALELANLYRIQGKRDEMVSEYLDYVTQTPTNSGYIKNLMQLLLTKPEELESLEKLLTDRVQKNQDSEVFSDLLIWTNLQSKNFYGAFIQARAYDKRFRKEQSKTLEIAQIALNNKDYKNADKAFLYVIKEFAATPNFLPAQLGLIRTREAQVKNSFPVNKDSVRYLIREFAQFRSRYPDHPSSFDARLSEALLHAYYLNELDSSVVVLNRLIGDLKAPAQLRNQSKVELGDIYLLKEEPWEATLLYSQVEKSQRETPLGYEAKLRNAKLSYYKGDFKLAQEHLDILKQATTREIANDALDLSMRIKENTAFDSTGAGLKEFAAIELLLAQNKMTEALPRLEQFQPKKKVWLSLTQLFEINYTGKILEKKDGLSLVEIVDPKMASTIQDDVYWLEANIRMKQGQFQQAIALLEKIVKEYPEEILTDDAVFLQADIYERHLKNKDKAMEIYRDFLNKYPGSVYAAEARKRFRNLRGDFAEEKPIVN